MNTDSNEYWQRCAEALLRDEVQTLIAERAWIVERLEAIESLLPQDPLDVHEKDFGA